MNRRRIALFWICCALWVLVPAPAFGQEPEAESSGFGSSDSVEAEVGEAGICGELEAGESCSATASERQLLSFLELFAPTVEAGCEIEPVSCCGGCSMRCPIGDTPVCRAPVWAWKSDGTCRCVRPPACACD